MLSGDLSRDKSDKKSELEGSVSAAEEGRFRGAKFSPDRLEVVLVVVLADVQLQLADAAHDRRILDERPRAEGSTVQV